MRFIIKWLGNPKRRMITVNIGILLVIGVSFLLLFMELLQNQYAFRSYYIQAQKKLLSQAVIREETLLQSNDGDFDSCITQIMSEVEASGRCFWFFTINGKIVYIKDSETTAIYKSATIDSFTAGYGSDLCIVTKEFKWNDKIYTTGICTDEDYIVEMGHLVRHDIYVCFLFAIVVLGLYSLIVYLVSDLNRRDEKLSKYNSELKEKNRIIDELSSKLRKSELAVGSDDIYGREVLLSFLKKMNHPELFPLGIIVIHIIQEEGNEGLGSIMRSISEWLEEDHMIGELEEAVYALLLFRAEDEKVHLIKDTLLERWSHYLSVTGTKVRIGVARAEKPDDNAYSILLEIYREVSK